MPVDREQVIQDLKHILIEDLFVEIPEDEISKTVGSFADYILFNLNVD